MPIRVSEHGQPICQSPEDSSQIIVNVFERFDKLSHRMIDMGLDFRLRLSPA
jgi:hypothetical protein